MSPKSLHELELVDEVLPEEPLDDLPEFTGFTPPPQPGVGYRWKLPDMTGSIYEPYESKAGMRLRVLFDRDHPLMILKSPGGRYNGDTFQTQMSNERRGRGKDKAVEASDIDYLLKALGFKSRPADGANKAYADVLGKLSGREFTSDLQFSWNCNAAREIYVLDPSTGKSVKKEGTMGCGRRYYQADRTTKPDQMIPKDKVTGEYPVELKCSCGAVVRAFANLDNMRA